MTASKWPLFIIFVTVVIDLLGFGIVLPSLPVYAKLLSASPTMIGLLMASFSAMQFLFAPIWGRLSDRVGRRPILILGLAGSVVFYALFGYASTTASLTLLFVARIGAGIAGATISTAQAYIADSTPPEKRTAGMALIGAAFGIGFTFGPLLGIVALSLAPEASLTTSGAGNKVASATAVMASDAVPVARVESLNPAPGYLASGLSMVALGLAVFALPESLRPGQEVAERHWLDLRHFQAAIRAPAIGSLILVGFVSVTAFAVFESTMALLARDVFLLSERQKNLLFAYCGITLILAQGVLVRRLSGKVRDERLSLSGVLLMLVGMLGLVAAIAVGRALGLVLMLPVLVTGFALLNTSVQSLISRRSRADEQGGILGVNQSASALARILGPLFGNILFGRMAALPYGIGALLLAIAGAIVLSLKPVPDAPSAQGAG